MNIKHLTKEDTVLVNL